MTRARLILAALRYRLKHEGETMTPDDYTHTQRLIDEYEERMHRRSNP